MRPSHVCEALHHLVRIRQPVFLWGPPGVGKSRLVADVARRQGRKLYDLRAVLLDPVDLRGLPRISDDGITSWCVPEFLPHPQDTEEGILFLDELNAAPPLVQAACYQLILDRRVGQYRLPDGWAVVAAGNRESDRAVTYRMPSALANRMVHLDVECHIDDWLDWARDNGIREDIQAFLRFRPRLLGLAIGLEVLEDEVFIVLIEEGRVKHAEVFPADGAVDEGIHEAADVGVAAVHLPRRVAAVDVVIHDFISPQAEDDAVFVADLLVDFDVGPVQGPQGDGPVHHELHVARPRRFLAGCRNLFAHVGCREDELP